MNIIDKVINKSNCKIKFRKHLDLDIDTDYRVCLHTLGSYCVQDYFNISYLAYDIGLYELNKGVFR